MTLSEEYYKTLIHHILGKKVSKDFFIFDSVELFIPQR